MYSIDVCYVSGLKLMHPVHMILVERSAGHLVCAVSVNKLRFVTEFAS